MNLITPEAAKRCEETLTPDQLRAVREVEERLAAWRLAKLKRLRNGSDDWSDVDMAFRADATNSHKRGFE